MRSIISVGLAVGVVGAATLYGMERIAALAVVFGMLGLGCLAGLGAAKWLAWAWFGRQLEAGARTGALACGISASGALAGLVTGGPHALAILAARSHFSSASLAPLIQLAGFGGWLGVDVLAVLLSALLGTGLAAVVAYVFALGKSTAAVTAIARAQQAAQALQRPDLLGAPLGGYALPVTAPASELLPTQVLPGLMPPANHVIPDPGPLSAPPIAGSFAAVSGPHSALPPAEPVRFPTAPVPRQPSGARPLGRQLTDAEREALAEWAAVHADDALQAQESKRAAPDSTYLNSPVPAKRSRKARNTRDWLC